MSVEHLADVLSEKTRSSSWVVVFKALVTVHHLMVHGNEVSMGCIQISFHLVQNTVSAIAKCSWFVKGFLPFTFISDKWEK